MRQVRGFTLIELVIAVAIVGVLALMAAPLMEVTAQRQRETELRIALRQIRSAIDAYHQAVLDKKIEAAADASGYPPDLSSLATGTRDLTDPEGKKLYFLRRVPRDPFFADATAAAADTWGKRAYSSPPEEPRAGEDVYDVYSLSEKKGLNGVTYREW